MESLESRPANTKKNRKKKDSKIAKNPETSETSIRFESDVGTSIWDYPGVRKRTTREV